MTQAPPRPTITEAEKLRRAKSIHSIRRSQQMEGGDISPFAKALFDEYIEGRLTTEEIRQKLFEHYGVKPK